MAKLIPEELLKQAKFFIRPTYDGSLWVELAAIRDLPYGDGTVGSHWPDLRLFLIDCFATALLRGDNDLSGNECELSLCDL